MAIKINGWLKRVGLVALIISVMVLVADRVMGVGAMRQQLISVVAKDVLQDEIDKETLVKVSTVETLLAVIKVTTDRTEKNVEKLLDERGLRPVSHDSVTKNNKEKER